MAAGTYPVRVEASLDAPLSRWLWLVKWLLLIPHYVVLVFLWLAFVVLSVVAFFAILFTGRYPRGIFEFNVGVLRWTWRVQYYAVGAFGTDRYPPFTLADDPAYPARLQIDYPQQLSRGLVLVKWWLLAIPHYLVVGLFTGGGAWLAWQSENRGLAGGWGLIGVLAVIAAVILLVTGRYPRQIFDFLLGMNRWVLRVAAYAGLMTDSYPPFRLDMGGPDPGGVILPAPPDGPAGLAQPGLAGQNPPGGRASAEAGGPAAGRAAGGQMAPGGAAPSPEHKSWTPGRVVAVIAGAVLAVASLGALGAGGAALWADTAGRHGGYVDLGSAAYRTAGYAVASDSVQLHAAGTGWDLARTFLGTVRIQATPADGTGPVFIGIAPAADADRYLAGTAHAIVHGPGSQQSWVSGQAGAAPAVPPAQAGTWTRQAAGPGTQTLVWAAKSGTWTVVAMNADGSRPVSVRMDAAATLPALPWIAAGLLAGGVAALTGGAFLIAIPARRASR